MCVVSSNSRSARSMRHLVLAVCGSGVLCWKIGDSRDIALNCSLPLSATQARQRMEVEAAEQASRMEKQEQLELDRALKAIKAREEAARRREEMRAAREMQFKCVPTDDLLLPLAVGVMVCTCGGAGRRRWSSSGGSSP